MSEPKIKASIPTELQEMKALAEYLNIRRLQWFHVPNEGRRSYLLGKLMKAIGLRSGVPDIMIISRPTMYRGERPAGMAIELKRTKESTLSANQNAWLSVLKANGWLTLVAYGAKEAIDFVEDYYT